MAARFPLLLSSILVASACHGPGAPARRSRSGKDPPYVEDLPFPVRLSGQQQRGREVYDEVCASCHGRAGRGDTATVPRVAGKLPDLSDKRYAQLTATELAARFAAAHGVALRSVVTREGTQAALSYLPVLAYPPDARGSAVRGRELYGRYCSSCHGTNGDGRGPAADLLETRPADFTRDPLVAARDFEALARDTRDGPGRPHTSSMPAWGLFFDQKMLADVAAYLPTFQAATSVGKPDPTGSDGNR